MAAPKKLVYGFGINDIKSSPRIKQEDGSYRLCEIYCRWSNMIRRCYHIPSRGASYEGCEVSCEWKSLSNFTTWYRSNHKEGLVIDKDLLSGKTYSPDTCLFIPPKVNSFIASANSLDPLPSGVHFNKEKGKFCSRVYDPFSNKKGKYTHLGYVSTAEEATIRFMDAKSTYADRLATLMDNPTAIACLKGRYRSGHWFFTSEIEKSRLFDNRTPIRGIPDGL